MSSRSGVKRLRYHHRRSDGRRVRDCKLTVSGAPTGPGKCLCRFVQCDCAESFCRWRTRMSSSFHLHRRFFQWVKCLFLCFQAWILTAIIKLDQHSGFYSFNTHISCSRTQPCRVGISVILLYDRSLTGQIHTKINYSSEEIILNYTFHRTLGIKSTVSMNRNVQP